MSHLQWIESIIDETVKNNGFYEDYCVKVHAENAKGDNYGSDIAFVEVFSKNNEEKPVFNLFMKYLPLNVEFMEKFKQMPGLFKTEINIYTKIIPRYQELQKQQNQPLMDFTPKCLYTKETENNAVIVLENIKPHGFTLHPKEKSMDSAHIRLLLKSLAQWHALSFVLKDQYVEEFKKLNETHKVSPWGMIFETHLSKVYDYSHKALHQILEETGEYDVLSKFKAKFKNLSAKEMMHSLLNNDKSEKHAILIHGDCWNGNFMFQYIIIPRYQELQKQQNQPLMDFTPKCLYTKETENNAVIVLENIKPHGFTLHPKEKSMDSAHIRLLLKSLAQWHALSFVLKDQYVEEFKKLNETHKVSPWGMIFETHLSKVYDYSHKALHRILEETGEYDVLSKFKAKFKNLSAKEMMDSLLNNDKSEKHVILIHGDCWNGNFMFQYSDQDHTEPTKVQILDFQIASLRSPIIDVSEFIYSTASSEEFKNIRQILMEYYDDLARNIRALGSDPDQVFSFSDFKEQWHKYSIHGITVALLAPVYLHLDDEPLDVANEEAMFDILPKQIAKPVVRKRMTDMAKCFASFEF